QPSARRGGPSHRVESLSLCSAPFYFHVAGCFASYSLRSVAAVVLLKSSHESIRGRLHSLRLRLTNRIIRDRDIRIIRDGSRRDRGEIIRDRDAMGSLPTSPLPTSIRTILGVSASGLEGLTASRAIP